RQAVALNPQSAVARAQLAQSLLALRRVGAAVAEAREAARADAGYAPARDVLGLALYHQGGPSQEALGHLREAVRLDPESAGAPRAPGTALRAAGRLGEAVEHSERAAQLQPDKVVFHFNFANNLKAADRRDEAIAEYEQAVRIDPAFGPAHHGVAVMLAEDGRTDEAIAR